MEASQENGLGLSISGPWGEGCYIRALLPLVFEVLLFVIWILTAVLEASNP